MDLFGAILVVILFVVLVDVLNIVARAREVVVIARESASVMQNPALDDDTKEASIQKNTLRLAYLLLLLVGGFTVSLVAPMAVVWVAELAGLLSLDGVFAMLIRWDFMLGATVFGVVAFVVLARRSR